MQSSARPVQAEKASLLAEIGLTSLSSEVYGPSEVRVTLRHRDKAAAVLLRGSWMPLHCKEVKG